LGKRFPLLLFFSPLAFALLLLWRSKGGEKARPHAPFAFVFLPFAFAFLLLSFALPSKEGRGRRKGEKKGQGERRGHGDEKNKRKIGGKKGGKTKEGKEVKCPPFLTFPLFCLLTHPPTIPLIPVGGRRG